MKNLDSHLVKTRVFSIIVFAIAMGIMEAICVVYIRLIIFPPDGNIANAATGNFNFGLEIVRETITIIMLTTVSLLAAYNWRTRLAMFFLAFGIWDIFYYLGLRIFINWPTSLMDWDALFLIPVAWYSPVLVPILISIYFILGSAFIIFHEGHGRKLKFSFMVVLLQFLAFVVWFYSFIQNSKIISSSAYENADYSWILFIIGIFLGVSSLLLSYLKGEET